MRCLAGWVAVAGVLVAGPAVQAAELPAGTAYQEVDGVVVGEGEDYHERVAATNGKLWKVAPDEVVNPADNAQPVSNPRGGKYIQILPDTGAGSTPLNPPSVSYRVRIDTPGTYRLYTRWEGNSSNFGASDSMFADIVELKDGTTPAFGTAPNVIPDWYELGQAVDANFDTNPWDGDGGPEQNVAGAANNPANFSITQPGDYTVRFTVREDGSAVDAWVLQLSSLAAPTGAGPPVSAVVPEPVGLGALGLCAAGLLLRRHRARRA